MSSIGQSPTSISNSPTSISRSPTAIATSPTSVYYHPPVSPAPSPNLVRQAPPNPVKQALQHPEVRPVQQLRITHVIGGAARYSPGLFTLRFIDTNGQQKTVYFGSLAEGQAYVSALRSGNAQTYTAGGFLFGSQTSAQTYAVKNPVQGETRTEAYEINGKQFSDVASMTDYVRTLYPGAVVTVSSPILPGRRDFTQTKIEFDITYPKTTTPANTLVSYVSTATGGISSFFSDIFYGSAVAGAEAKSLLGSGRLLNSQQYANIGSLRAPSGLTLAQASGLAGEYFGTAFILAESAVISYPVVGALEASLGIPELGGAGIVGRITQLGVRAAYGSLIGAGLSRVTGQNEAQSTVETGLLFAGLPLLFEGLGVAYNVARGQYETFANPPAALVSSGRIMEPTEFEDYLTINPPETVLPVRSVSVTRGSLLSMYEPPEELGISELGGATPGLRLSTGGKGFTDIFVEEFRADVGIHTESDILASSVLAKEDLAQFTKGTGGFVDSLLSRAPAKLPNVSDAGRFAESFAKGAREAEEDLAMRSSSARSEEVSDLLSKYDEQLMNPSERQTSALQAPKEEQSAITSETSSIQDAIDVSRIQFELQASYIHAYARGQVESDYEFLVYPPGAKMSLLPAQKGEFAQLTVRSQLVSTLQALNVSERFESLLSTGQVLRSETLLSTGQVQALQSETLTALMSMQVQAQGEEAILFPQPYTESKRKRRVKQKPLFSDYTLHNILAADILSSFGEVGYALALEDSFLNPPATKSKRGKSEFEELTSIGASGKGRRKQRSDFDMLVGLS